MGAKIIIAAILGGAAIFGAGFVDHMIFDWTGRAFKKPEQETELRAALKKYFPTPGIYGTPSRPANFGTMNQDDKKKAFDEIAPLYKEAAGYFIVPPTGGEMMDKQQLIMQGAAGAIAALLVSMVIGMTRPEVGFFGRWFACVLIGAAIWLSSSASNYIWYKYPQEFVLDELFCKLFEWACGGFFIAAIVRPRNKMLGY